MKISGEHLIVFPTAAAKRAAEFRLAADRGVADTSRLLTQKMLFELCERTARRAGLLTGRTPGTAELRLLIEEAAAVRFAPEQPLARLSEPARAALLQQLIEAFAVFAGFETTLLEWMEAHGPAHKLYGMGRLLRSWLTLCAGKGISSRFEVNTALLRLIETGPLPAELDHGIEFRAVRWFNPFEERFVAALKQRLPRDQVRILSALPPAHAECAEDRLGAAVRSELMRASEEEWKPWLEDFADALGADDANLLDDRSREHVTFFVSANPYGEIEDAARRICRDLETGMPPDRIALIVRDLSPYADIIPDVFERFGIPRRFRRGTPAAAIPAVKTLLALLRFPYSATRDRLGDLLLSPAIRWPAIDDPERLELVRTLRRSEPPRIRRLPPELRRFPWLDPAAAPAKITPSRFAAGASSLIEAHQLLLPDEVTGLIRETGLVETAPLPAERMFALFEELLGNLTLPDGQDAGNGVRILNAMDAAGLSFDSVYLAGMDDRSFPGIPGSDGLLNRSERTALKKFLEARNLFCPRLALTGTAEALIQEEILFLTAIGSARERLTLSCCRADAAGKELAAGEFFERMRLLAGAGAPGSGESFCTILPPAACRAPDEIRQTRALYAFRCGSPPPPAQDGPARDELSTAVIAAWLQNHPELSATALESLARNRFVFFLEKILGIRPQRTLEDAIDPQDRGSLIHTILEQVYTATAARSGLYAAQDEHGWKIAQRGDIPLAVFDPAASGDLLELATSEAEACFRRAEQNPLFRSGHPAVWKTEKRKILQIVRNVVCTDLNTAQKENRYPALFELKFDAASGVPVTLHREGETLRLKGRVDRIDLLFDPAGRLQQVLVADYKSTARRDSIALLAKKTALNLDCQLPLYIFAAQQRFFGNCNTPELNNRVQAVYHLQERDPAKMVSHFQRQRFTLTPEICDAFLETLFTNIRKLRAGDLAAEPLIAGYEDYSHICRTAAIDPKELLNEDSADS